MNNKFNINSPIAELKAHEEDNDKDEGFKSLFGKHKYYQINDINNSINDNNNSINDNNNSINNNNNKMKNNSNKTFKIDLDSTSTFVHRDNKDATKEAIKTRHKESIVFENYKETDYYTDHVDPDQDDFNELLATLKTLNLTLKRHTHVLVANNKYQECINYTSNNNNNPYNNTNNNSCNSYSSDVFDSNNTNYKPNINNILPASNNTTANNTASSRTPTTPFNHDYNKRLPNNPNNNSVDKSAINDLYPMASIGFHHQASRSRKMFSLDELIDGTQNRKLKSQSFRQHNACSDTPNDFHDNMPTSPVEIVRSKKTSIQARIVFLKLGEIDTLHDRFNASVFIQARWREPALDHTFFKDTDQIDWSKYWTPKLFIENVFGDIREQVELSVTYDSQGKATVWEKRRVLSQFQEFMELNKFPFDTQDLTVTLTSERTDEEVEILEDTQEKCALNAQSFVDEQEWKLHRIVVTWKRTRADDNKAPKTVHSAFSAACKASRRPEFFIWNIFVVMFLICSLSFATFSVEVNLPQNRLQLSFILLLTTVSFKFVVNQSLPMIAYLTYLDKYILGSMSILCCICVWHSVVPLFNNGKQCCDPAALFADTLALAVLSAIYILFHIVFIFFIACVTSKTRTYDRNYELFPEICYKNSDASRTDMVPGSSEL